MEVEPIIGLAVAVGAYPLAKQIISVWNDAAGCPGARWGQILLPVLALLPVASAAPGFQRAFFPQCFSEVDLPIDLCPEVTTFAAELATLMVGAGILLLLLYAGASLGTSIHAAILKRDAMQVVVAPGSGPRRRCGCLT